MVSAKRGLQVIRWAFSDRQFQMQTLKFCYCYCAFIKHCCVLELFSVCQVQVVVSEMVFSTVSLTLRGVIRLMSGESLLM